MELIRSKELLGLVNTGKQHSDLIERTETKAIVDFSSAELSTELVLEYVYMAAIESQPPQTTSKSQSLWEREEQPLDDQ